MPRTNHLTTCANLHPDKYTERTCSKSANDLRQLNNSPDRNLGTTIRHTIVPHSSRSTTANKHGRRLPHHTHSSTNSRNIHCPLRIHEVGHPLHINDPSLNKHKHRFKIRVPITRSAAQDKSVERCGLNYHIRH